MSWWFVSCGWWRSSCHAQGMQACSFAAILILLLWEPDAVSSTLQMSLQCTTTGVLAAYISYWCICWPYADAHCGKCVLTLTLAVFQAPRSQAGVGWLCSPPHKAARRRRYAPAQALLAVAPADASPLPQVGGGQQMSRRLIMMRRVARPCFAVQLARRQCALLYCKHPGRPS